MGPVPRRVAGTAGSTGRSSRSRRILLGATVGAAALALSACGFNAYTNRTYHPAEGINFDVGTVQTEPAVKVRNLVIVATGEDAGYLSATITAVRSDETLTSVNATQLNADGTDGSALTVSVPAPIPVGNRLVVLTQEAPITVTGPVSPGLTARITMVFSSAGQATEVTTVVSSAEPPWNQVTPAASATPSATPSS